MTTRVYVTGDPATDMTAWDADTGKQLVGVSHVSIGGIGSPKLNPTVRVQYGGGAAKEYALVPAPTPKFRAGEELLGIHLALEDDAASDTRCLQVTARRYEVDPGGVVRRRPRTRAKDLVLRRMICRFELAASPDPIRRTLDAIARACEDLGGAIAGELSAAIPPRSITQGPVSSYVGAPTAGPSLGSLGSPTIDLSPGGSLAKRVLQAKEAPCAECRGTGYWENPANGKRSACSRGCKP